MAYTHTNSKGQTYFLHSKKVTLKGGLSLPIYYFAKKEDSDNSINAVPAGYVVTENRRTGLPLLKKG